MEEERVFNKIPVNKYQTEITEELLSHYPEELLGYCNVCAFCQEPHITKQAVCKGQAKG